MKKLTLHAVSDINDVAYPDSDKKITADSSALLVFTDFSLYHPFDLNQHTPAREAIHLMRVAHVRLKFVVDDEGQFLGVVSTDDLNEQAIIKKQTFGSEVEDMSVMDFMRPKTTLQAIEYAALQEATIGDVMHLLQTQGVQHCLVVDAERNHIRGVISSSDIARKLRLAVDVMKSPDFIQVFEAVMQHTAH